MSRDDDAERGRAEPIDVDFEPADRGYRPAHGGISGFNSATGAFTYTPTGGYSGPDVLTFSACDNGAPSL